MSCLLTANEQENLAALMITNRMNNLLLCYPMIHSDSSRNREMKFKKDIEIKHPPIASDYTK